MCNRARKHDSLPKCCLSWNNVDAFEVEGEELKMAMIFGHHDDIVNLVPAQICLLYS